MCARTAYKIKVNTLTRSVSSQTLFYTRETDGEKYLKVANTKWDCRRIDNCLNIESTYLDSCARSQYFLDGS